MRKTLDTVLSGIWKCSCDGTEEVITMRKLAKRSLSSWDSGWLSPDGTFYPLGDHTHWSLAEQIAKRNKIPLQGSAYSHFFKNGWIRISGDSGIVPVVGVEFMGDLDKTKSLLKSVYPEYFGQIFISKKELGVPDTDEIYFKGPIDDLWRWNGKKSLYAKIKKYSALKTASKYDFPKKGETSNYQEYRKKLYEVMDNRKALLQEKLLPSGGEVPSLNPDIKYLVTKEPTNNAKWRITFLNNIEGEWKPTGHIVCKSLTEGTYLDTVLGSLSSPDWDALEGK